MLPKINDGIDKDPMVQRWLSQVSATSTKNNYIGAMRRFVELTKLTPSELIKEAYEDSVKNPVERQDIAARRVMEFYNWCKTEAPVRDVNRRIVGKGFSDGGASIKAKAIHSFYTKILKIDLGMSGKLNEGRKTNERIPLSTDQVRSLVENARTIRDRAMFVFAYQSLMDSDTITKLKAGEVLPHLDEEPPVMIKTYREKAHQNYYTFIGPDSVRLLKAYVNDLNHKGVELKDDDPLFITERKQGNKIAGVETATIQAAIKAAALKSGLIKKGSKWNAAGFHALREGASRILLHNAGIDKYYIDFMLGHKLSNMDSAYFGGDEEKLRAEYKKGMGFLAISVNGNGKASKEDVEVLRGQVAKLQDRVSKLEGAMREALEEFKK